MKTKKVGDRIIQTIPVVDVPHHSDLDNIIGSLRIPKDRADQMASLMREGVVFRLYSTISVRGAESTLLNVSIHPVEATDV